MTKVNSYMCSVTEKNNNCLTFIDLSERFFDLGHQIVGIHAWQDGTPGQVIRDLAIYEKQILEGILESLYGRLGFSNL